MGCVILRQEEGGYQGKQGGIFAEGVSAESVGSKGLCMHVLRIPAHSRGEPHKHTGHESAIYVVSGTHQIRHGMDLEHTDVLHPGDMVYIPADMPHMPMTGEEPVVAVVARTDPSEQESVHLLSPRDPSRPS
ncbi:cupin domain-containing protein [Streptomyces sp. AJS327]|uniref:cupin domain-containing protein n=1 Tax=Streptomyces sp. AJS327 TaxID=2545265 RepID=UPI0015DE1272|nr:cupin domain-containing protein [Streptomyces sp. AJS327]MBA0054009.1 cupin domain-containing protein [Streptomyces sp. AJS327]